MTITYADRTVETFNYCGGVIYHDQDLESIEFGVGRVVKKPDSHFYYQYYMTDHLGNIRQVYEYNESTHEVEVVQENNYYPYGLTMGGLNIYSGIESTHLYQGKELENKTRLNWYDFHARRFDSQLGRWHAIDPVVQFASPYVGMGNNPVRNLDPNGKFTVIPPWLWEEISNHYFGIVNLHQHDVVGDKPQPYPTYFTWWNDFQDNYNSCQGGGNTQWQYQNSNASKGSGGGHGNSGSYSGPWGLESNWGNNLSSENNQSESSTKELISLVVAYINVISKNGELIIGTSSEIVQIPNVGYNIAYIPVLAEVANNLEITTYWCTGIAVLSDWGLTALGKQSWTESLLNTGVRGLALYAGGWYGIALLVHYEASKLYMEAIIDHPEYFTGIPHGR